MDIRLHIVAPESRKEKVFTELRRPVISLLDRGPLAESCTYLSYDSVEELLALPHLHHLSASVLDDHARILLLEAPMRHLLSTPCRSQCLATQRAGGRQPGRRRRLALGPLLALIVVLLGLPSQPVAGRSDEVGEFVAGLIERAEAGEAQFQVTLGILYEQGIGVDPDPAEAFHWVHAAAMGGHVLGRSLLARAYAEGIGVQRDEEEALRLFQEDAEAVILGFSLDDAAVFRRTPESVLEAAREDRGPGSAAQLTAALLYLTGQGVEPSDVDAVAWLEKAAERNPIARQLLGLMWQQGRGGLTPDASRAMHLYRQAAEESARLVEGSLAMVCLQMTGQRDCRERPPDVASLPDETATGSVSGDTYQSATGRLSVRIPPPANFAGIPYAVQGGTFESPLSGHEAVRLIVPDFGELLVAGVMSLPEGSGWHLPPRGSRSVLESTTVSVLPFWRKDLPSKPRVVEQSFVETQFGEALLTVFAAERGSLLVVSEGGRAAERFDAEILVLIGKRGHTVIYALGQNDSPLSEERRTEIGKQRLLEFFSGLRVQ